MKIKYAVTFIVTFAAIILVGCQQTNATLENDGKVMLDTFESIPLTDSHRELLAEQISPKLNLNHAILSDIEVTEATYTNSEIKSVNFKLTDDLTYTVFRKGEAYSDIKVYFEQRGNDLYLLNTNLDEIGYYYTSEDQEVVFTLISTAQKANAHDLHGWRDWFEDYDDCLQDNFELIMDNAYTAIGCGLIFAECAGGLLVGCAVSASFDRFR